MRFLFLFLLLLLLLFCFVLFCFEGREVAIADIGGLDQDGSKGNGENHFLLDNFESRTG